MRHSCLILVSIACCVGEPENVGGAPQAGPVPPASDADGAKPGRTRAVAAPAVARAAEESPRCLPLVAAECGCVWGCSIGTPAPDGSYLVQHPRIAAEGVKATIQPWCVHGACTDAFHGEILCSAICAPKPAEARCHFDGTGACVGAAAE